MTDGDKTPDGIDPLLDEVVDPIGSVSRATWWLILIRGICAVVFGVIALLAPVTALVAIVFVFAAYALVEGVVEIVHALSIRTRHARWGWLLAMGVISVLAGIVAFVFPMAAGLIYGSFGLAVIAFYAVMMGIAGFPAAAAATDGGRKALGYVVAVASILLGVVLAIILIVDPIVAILNLIWVVGIWAIVIGVTLAIAAITARVSGRAVRSGSAATPARG